MPREFEGILNIGTLSHMSRKIQCNCCKKHDAVYVATMETESYEGGPFSVEACLCQECWDDQMENITDG